MRITEKARKLVARIDTAERSAYCEIGQCLSMLKFEFFGDTQAWLDYCFRAWRWARATVYYKIRAWEVAELVAKSRLPVPRSKSVALALDELKSEEKIIEAWRRASKKGETETDAADVYVTIAEMQNEDPEGIPQVIGEKMLAGIESRDPDLAKKIREGSAPKPRMAVARKPKNDAAMVARIHTKLRQVGKLIDQHNCDRKAAHELLAQLRSLIEGGPPGDGGHLRAA